MKTRVMHSNNKVTINSLIQILYIKGLRRKFSYFRDQIKECSLYELIKLRTSQGLNKKIAKKFVFFCAGGGGWEK